MTQDNKDGSKFLGHLSTLYLLGWGFYFGTLLIGFNWSQALRREATRHG